MNFLYRIRCAMARFMYGRNGVDQLSWALLIFELAISLLVPMLGIDALTIAAQIVSYICSFLIFFRIFSRNLPKRRAENAKFMGWWQPKRNAIAGAKARNADKEHKYVKCTCGTYCRVPKNVGKIELTCPKCGAKKIVKT
ncbi:MAG: hypothetical protein IKL99_01205 [Oscillospiraceae bacterium]|nr:hypothetical protein [Oscillospiraceae bacterium]